MLTFLIYWDSPLLSVTDDDDDDDDVTVGVYVRVHTGDIPAHCLLLFACVSPPWEETRNGEIHGVAIFASSINRNTRNTHDVDKTAADALFKVSWEQQCWMQS